MPDTQINKNWFVLYTYPRAEFKVEDSLKLKEIEVFLPVKKMIKQWSDRKKEIIFPLFPSYIFIYANERERLVSLEDSLVVRCLCNGHKPAMVPDWQIDSLKKMLLKNSEPRVFEELVSGDRIEITNGPMQGVTGIIKYNENNKQLAVSIELINRTVFVHLSEDTSFVKI